MDKSSRVYVAGAEGFLGSALVKGLKSRGFANLINEECPEISTRNGPEVLNSFLVSRPEFVFLTGGSEGGIQANQRVPADLMTDNLSITLSVISASFEAKVKRLLFFGSSCSYPRDAIQPIQPEALMTGPLEATNSSYAVAKLAGIELCHAYRQQYKADFLTAIPANLYGPGDNFDQEGSHVIAALISRMSKAKAEGKPSIEIWGSGLARRDFLFIDDAVDAALFAMEHYEGTQPLNISSGCCISISELAEMVKALIGFNGDLVYDRSKPDGAPVKCLDHSQLSDLGWKPKVGIREGLSRTFSYYQAVTKAERGNNEL